MKDAFERRALLLHLGAVLDALGKLLARSGDGTATMREVLSAHRSLSKLPLLQHLSCEVTAREFAQQASAAFAAWPAALLEAKLDREYLASVVRDGLFATHHEGWRAYVASLKQDVPWFGDGLPMPPQTEAAALREPVHRADEPRGTQHEATTAGTGGVYPSWPWKPQR
ncbi:hypothetical protein [Paraburkholderia solisilvae]|nr:hypothetical protein [Paraburkholderia solisilvae]